MSVTMSDLVVAWRSLFKTSNLIESFCQSNFSKSLKLYVGHDSMKEQSEDDCPFISIIPIGYNPGLTQQEVTWTIDIDFGVNDPTFEDYQSNGVIEQKGVYLVDQLFNLILEELESFAGEHNLIADMVDIEFDTSTYQNIKLGTMSVQAKLTIPIGAEVHL